MKKNTFTLSFIIVAFISIFIYMSTLSKSREKNNGLAETAPEMLQYIKNLAGETKEGPSICFSCNNFESINHNKNCYLKDLIDRAEK